MAEGCNAKGKDTSQPDKKEACYKSSADREQRSELGGGHDNKTEHNRDKKCNILTSQSCHNKATTNWVA